MVLRTRHVANSIRIFCCRKKCAHFNSMLITHFRKNRDSLRNVSIKVKEPQGKYKC
jgi:phosphoheptose isomerase